MKKSLFVLFLPFLMASCQGKSVSGYEEDAKRLRETAPSEFLTKPSMVKASVYSEKQGDTYLYSLIVDEATKRLEKVKVIVSTEDDSQYFFFGYDRDYTLIPKAVPKEGLLIHGIKINFRLSGIDDTFKVRFSSSEMVENFIVSVSDTN